jgi:hypothetical protein
MQPQQRHYPNSILLMATTAWEALFRASTVLLTNKLLQLGFESYRPGLFNAAKDLLFAASRF